MKTISTEMETHVQQVTTTRAICMRVERLDGVVLCATSFNRALEIDGEGSPPTEVYEPFGFNSRDVASNDNLDVGTTEVETYLDSETITEDDVRIGRWDYTAYELFWVNWDDLTMGRDPISSGTLGVMRTGRLRVIAELLSLMQVAQNSLGNLNSPQCIHNFGMAEGGPGRGNGCTFDLATVTETGTVESVDSDYYGIHDSARTEPDAYFSNGTFRITSGPYAGIEREIRAYIVGEWVLMDGAPGDVSGETYDIVRGCNKSLRQCVDDYDNILDRLASDFTQGGDAAISVARHGEE